MWREAAARDTAEAKQSGTARIAKRSCSKRLVQQRERSRAEWSRTTGVRSRAKATEVQSRQSLKSAERKQTENTRKDTAGKEATDKETEIRQSTDKALEQDTGTRIFCLLEVGQQEQGNSTEKSLQRGTIKFYRRAMQLVPDIEFKINYNWSPDADGVGKNFMDDANDDSKMSDLLSYFQQQLTFQESSLKLCQPEYDVSQTHISVLPMEVLMYIFRWVVSSELDLRSLEQLSLVCKGFYICARDPEIWRLACLKVWGRSCVKMVPYITWRQMFLERPRVRCDGVYISKTTYIRQGEQSLDGFYRAWHQIYEVFFPEGQIIMLTTPEDPQTIVPRLRTKNSRTDAMLLGHYRLSQDTDNQTKVFAVITNKKEEKSAEYQKYRYFRRGPVQETDRSFHVGLQLCSSGRYRFNKLVHRETAVTAFDIDKMYTPLFFARVKSFTATSERPL
ncbi:unnamed protein product [Ranitomeya imitator]|uniref:F-box only protein n=1 Tax=Ranitomeya imitator TaxID=111125 RepID=A0ABN9L0W4_9NEOB|nr:unnamed protein product [Ranitomeya imitator]